MFIAVIDQSILCFPGILITAYNQAEIFIPSRKKTIPLPSIPGSPRVWHTLTRNILCGGVYPGTSTTCLELQQNGEGWQRYGTTLTESRVAHSAWDSPQGVVLLGGYSSSHTTELVTRLDGTKSMFSLNGKVRSVESYNLRRI